MATNIGPSTSGGSAGGDGTEKISIVNYEDPAAVDEPMLIDFEAQIAEPEPNEDLDVDIIVYAFVATDPVTLSSNNELSGGNPSASLSEEDLDQNTIVSGTLSLTFDEPTNSIEFWLLAGFDYHGVQGYSRDRNFPDKYAWSASEALSVNEAPQSQPDRVRLTDDDISLSDSAGDFPLSPAQQAFPRSDFKLFDIQFERDANVTDIFGQPSGSIDGENLYRIDFDYAPNPDIAIDTGGRFVKHEIIGGPVVRQKVGEDPDQYSIDGVCIESTARQVDALKDARFGKIASERIPGRRGQPVQFGSPSTEPIAEGGGVDIPPSSVTGIPEDNVDFLYTYSINAVEIHRNIQEDSSNQSVSIL